MVSRIHNQGHAYCDHLLMLQGAESWQLGEEEECIQEPSLLLVTYGVVDNCVLLLLFCAGLWFAWLCSELVVRQVEWRKRREEKV